MNGLLEEKVKYTPLLNMSELRSPSSKSFSSAPSSLVTCGGTFEQRAVTFLFFSQFWGLRSPTFYSSTFGVPDMLGLRSPSFDYIILCFSVGLGAQAPLIFISCLGFLKCWRSGVLRFYGFPCGFLDFEALETPFLLISFGFPKFSLISSGFLKSARVAGGILKVGADSGVSDVDPRNRWRGNSAGRIKGWG